VIGPVSLAVVQKDGSTTSLAPATVALNGSTTNVTVTIPPNLTPPLRIRVSDANSNSGDSAAFDPMRSVGVTAADLVWDASRSRFYASVPATASAYANRVVAIDPATMQVVASTAVGQNPGPLALTTGGEALYVGLNGNGMVVRINPQTMAVVETFSLGFATNGGPLRASDIATVAGQPDTILVERRELGSSYSSGIAVYDNSVMRPNIGGASGIEASADPQIFFAEVPYSGFAKFRLDPNGLTRVALERLLPASATMQADGNFVLSGNALINGATLQLLGNFTLSAQNGLATFRPDMAGNRAYLIEQLSSGSGGSANTISAYDATTFALVRRATMPTATSVASLIRWGGDGLAFRTASSINVIRAAQLVPADYATDLRAQIEASPASGTPNTTETYTVRVTNSGVATARNARVNITLSDGQSVERIDAGTPTTIVSESVVTWQVGDLPPGASATMSISTLLQDVGSVSCTAQATMSSRDVLPSNDFAFKLVPVGFNSGTDAANQLRLPANNLLFDSSRNVVWATFPSSVPPPLGGALVSIDPATGLMSDPIPLVGSPQASCIALSRNSRYLYVGASDQPAVARVDLSASAYSATRLWLGVFSTYGNVPKDIEVLDGDGTSFITTATEGAAVYDGEVRRPQATSFYTATRIERGASPGQFVAFGTGTSSNPVSLLTVTASGVSVTRTVNDVIRGNEIRTAGNIIFSSGGQLADATTFALRASVGGYAQPVVDALNGRAYHIFGTEIRAYDTSNGARTGTFYVPTGRSDDWATTALRWGADGFAIAGAGNVYLARWSAVDRSNADDNGDGVADLWQIEHFGTTNVDLAADPDRDGIANVLEYFFGSQPLQANANPLQFRIEPAGGSRVIHLIYPRRASIPAAHYRYEVSADLQQWNPAETVTETVLGTHTIGGVQYQMIDAAIPALEDARSFARLKWLGPQ
jgi:sugar lactone lactonase YvrE